MLIKDFATRMMKRFFRREDGAITVDWVVLVSMAIALCFAVLGAMSASTLGLTDDTVEYMNERPTD